jgi:hypothetical protein
MVCPPAGLFARRLARWALVLLALLTLVSLLAYLSLPALLACLSLLANLSVLPLLALLGVFARLASFVALARLPRRNGPVPRGAQVAGREGKGHREYCHDGAGFANDGNHATRPRKEAPERRLEDSLSFHSSN